MYIPEQEIQFEPEDKDDIEEEEKLEEQMKELIGLLELADLMVLYNEGSEVASQEKSIDSIMNSIDANRLSQLPTYDTSKLREDQLKPRELFIDESTG